MTSSYRFLTPVQIELATSVAEALNSAEPDDAMVVLISVAAATCNNAYDGGAISLAMATRLAKNIMETVEAGQHHDLRMNGEVLQ